MKDYLMLTQNPPDKLNCSKITYELNDNKHLNNSRYQNSIVFILYIIISQLVFPSQEYAQVYSISGKITSSRFPVKYASITFIDNADTTRQYSALTDDKGNYQIGLVTSISSNPGSAPASFNLGQSYPNPFSSTAAIPYGLNKESNVQVIIYDILGRIVRKFEIGYQSGGSHHILWNGRNNLGQIVADGIYFYRLNAEGESKVKKMIYNSNGNSSFAQPGASVFVQNEYLKKNNPRKKFHAGTFSVTIQNTNTTTPLIKPDKFENVVIQNDTTINFSVLSVTAATIDLDSLHQKIRGYGAASPWYLPVMTDSEVESAFGIDNDQIGFSIFRITLEPDSNLWGRYVPSAKKAYEMGAIIIAAPWYAPEHMVNRIDGKIRVRHDMYDEYAQHLNSFTAFMANNGAPVYGVSIQNEPDISDTWTWWDPDEMLTFMRDHAHAIEGTQVMAPESFQFRKNMSDPILNDSLACANTDIICGHIYGGGLSKYPLAGEKGKEVWMTEYLMGENNSGNNWPWALELAQNINDVMEADMSAYVWWTIVRYYGPIGDGTIASNPQDPNESYPAKGEVTKKGYVLSQFSKFIRPGFCRTESSVTPLTNKVKVTAYKDPLSSKVVIIAVNIDSAELELTVRIQNGQTEISFTPYTTSEFRNVEQGSRLNVNDGIFKFVLEASSITTFVSD